MGWFGGGRRKCEERGVVGLVASSRRQVVARVVAMWLLVVVIQCLMIGTKAWPYQKPEAWSEAKFFQWADGFKQGIEQFGEAWRYPNGSFQETLLLRPDGHFYIKLESE